MDDPNLGWNVTVMRAARAYRRREIQRALARQPEGSFGVGAVIELLAALYEV